jgi:hypothetical protein
VLDQHAREAAREAIGMISIQKSIVVAVAFLAVTAGTGWADSEAEHAIGSDGMAVEQISGVAQAAATTALSLGRIEMMAEQSQSHGVTAGSDGIESTWQMIQPVSIGSDGVESMWYMIQPVSIGSDGVEGSVYSAPRQTHNW